MVSTARLAAACATCHQAGFLEIGQQLTFGKLEWFEHFSCACGHGFQTGGLGLPAPGLRKAIITQSGRAEVWLDEPNEVPAVLAWLVDALSVPEAEAKQRLAKLPAIAFEGTHVEAAFIALSLQKRGAMGRVVNHLPGDRPPPATAAR